MSNSNIAGALPLLFQSIGSRIVGGAPLASTQNFLDGFQSVLSDPSPSPAKQEFFFHIGRGFLQPLDVVHCTAYDPGAEKEESQMTDAQKILRDINSYPGGRPRRIASKSPQTVRALKEARTECSEIFLSGALRAFPEASDRPIFDRLARLWSSQRFLSGRDLPLTEEMLERSRSAGNEIGQRLKRDHDMGLLLHLDASWMDRRLASGNMIYFAFYSGMILGAAEFLKKDHPGASELLIRKRDTIIAKAYQSNAWLRRWIALPLPKICHGFFYSDQAILRLEAKNPGAAVALRKKQSSAVWRTITHQSLDITQSLEGLPTLSEHLEGRINEMKEADPRMADKMERLRDEILSNAEHSNFSVSSKKWFDAVDESIRSLPRQIEAWEKIILDAREGLPAYVAEALLDREDRIFQDIVWGRFSLLDGVFFQDLLSAIAIIEEKFRLMTQATPEIAEIPAFSPSASFRYALTWHNDILKGTAQAASRTTSVWEDFDRTVENLKSSNPERAAKLQSKRASVLSFSLKNGDVEGPKKFVECLRHWPDLIDLIS